MSYIKLQNKHRIDTFRRALTVGLGAQLLAAPVLLAQDAAQPATSSEPLELERVVITGSLIPTAETVTVTPVDIYSATAIQDVGSTDVLNALRRLSPDFGGSLGQESGNGGSAGEAYIQLRNLPTLVLLDGTRLANSAFSQGELVDANSIPTSMIERIEVLKDGGSVLYGSQAIGGVVNIITKKNYTGVDMGGRWGFGTEDGNYNENQAYVVFGSTTDKAKFVGGIQHYHADQILAKDREYASYSTTELINLGVAPAQSYLSPSFAGRVQSGGENFVLAGSPLLKGTSFYNPAITKPPVVAGQSFATVQEYNAVHPGIYINIKETPAAQALDAVGYGGATAYGILNTTDFGSAMNNSQDRNQAFANASYELFGKEMEIYGTFLYANTISDFTLAPAPVTALDAVTSKIFVPANDPNNPFQRNLGWQSPTPDGNVPRVRSRFVESGTRDFQNQNDIYHFVGGLKGQFDSNWAYNAYYDYNRNEQIQYTRNAINGSALDSALTPSPDPALAAAGLSALKDEAGYVPLYNIFAVSGNDPRTLDAVRATLYNSGVSELWDAQGVVTGRPFELPGGDVGVAFGGGYLQESLELDVDGLTRIGKVPGLNPTGPTPGGTRDNGYGFVEVTIPIFGPNLEIPVFHSLQITAAGRYETFTTVDTSNDKAVPKVGIRWQPLDETITLRATYSQSFVAPTVWELFGGPATSFEFVTDGQAPMTWESNSLLSPATADNWSGGVVWSPKFVKGLVLTCDYYNVSTEDGIYRRSGPEVYDSITGLGVNSPYAAGFTYIDGSRLTATSPQVDIDNWGNAPLPLLNGSSIETSGFDLSVTYAIPLDSYGLLTLYNAANIVIEYNYTDPIVGGPYDISGQFTDVGFAGETQGVIPNFKFVTGLSWLIHNFTVSVNAQYIPGVTDYGDAYPGSGNDANFFTISGEPWQADPFFSVNMLLAYAFKSAGGNTWYDGVRLAAGVNNISDRQPSLLTSASNSNTDASAYDTIGRFVYFEVGKKF